MKKQKPSGFAAYLKHKTSPPLLMTHRGYGKKGIIAENTLEAFSASEKLGFHAHELDIRLSKDKTAVVFHGPRLERTTNGSGFLENRHDKELEKLDWGYYLGNNKKRNPSPILYFSQYLERFADNTMTNIEIKKEWFRTGFLIENTALKMINRYNPDHFLFSSFNFLSIFYLRLKAPSYHRGILLEKNRLFLFILPVLIYFTRPDSIHIHYSLLNKKLCDNLNKKGAVVTWGVQTVEDYRCCQEWNVAIAITDNIDLITDINQIFLMKK